MALNACSLFEMGNFLEDARLAVCHVVRCMLCSIGVAKVMGFVREISKVVAHCFLVNLLHFVAGHNGGM